MGAIRLVYHIGGERHTLGIGIVVPVNEWDRAKKFLRPTSASWGRLAAIRSDLDTLVVRSMREGINITSATVRGVVLGDVVKEVAEVNDVDVWAWLFHYAKTKPVSYHAALLSYQRHDGSTPTQETLAAWNVWIASKESGKSAGTAHVYLGAVGAMLVKARKANVIGWKAEVERPTLPAKRGKVAMTDKQVKALEGLRLEGEHDLVRDLLLLGIYTALRRSDWDVRTSELATIKNLTKGKGTALVVDTIPLRTLLGKYDGHLSIDMFYNEHLGHTANVLRFDRALAEVMAKLSVKCKDLNEVIEHRGKLVPKWRAVGSHSGRKSFVSKYARLLPLPTVMQATGHRSLAQFSVYVQSTVDDKVTAKLFR